MYIIDSLQIIAQKVKIFAHILPIFLPLSVADLTPEGK
jgi:hypothetical protein